MLLSGGVGGARMARALASVVPADRLTVVVNVGDDDRMYGVHVSPDIDTVVYTLAGIEGPQGWGQRGDTFAVMDGLARFGVDTSFRLGDRDLALCLHRTRRLGDGVPLSTVTTDAAAALGVNVRVLPATDDRLRTKVLTADAGWLDFQEYFVIRAHKDRVLDVHFEGAGSARPAPGVLDAIARADAVLIAPSNPVLSIEPILAVDAIKEAIIAKPVVAAVSPFFSGKALKGPAATITADLGRAPGTEGLIEAYADVISHLVVDTADTADVRRYGRPGLSIHATPTTIIDPRHGASFATRLLAILGSALEPVGSS